jgi:hypothetical protein
MDFQCQRNRDKGFASYLEVLLLLQEFSSFILFIAWCILIVMNRFSMKFPVTHIKFPGDNVPASPTKETALHLQNMWRHLPIISVLFDLPSTNDFCFCLPYTKNIWDHLPYTRIFEIIFLSQQYLRSSSIKKTLGHLPC